MNVVLIGVGFFILGLCTYQLYLVRLALEGIVDALREMDCGCYDDDPAQEDVPEPPVLTEARSNEPLPFRRTG